LILVLHTKFYDSLNSALNNFHSSLNVQMANLSITSGQASRNTSGQFIEISRYHYGGATAVSVAVLFPHRLRITLRNL
jgi:hypothetical protein